ncbi:ATP-binding protein [uncultured Flavobacterium sp.]|uniref:sensor histidine kinase n=1 Tax=uncultured Flavobacterium sp. TaxID=165435 RepID=UPI0025D75A9F|nr:ATP-binding protein [uncultured Flavobacterium sp.]
MKRYLLLFLFLSFTMFGQDNWPQPVIVNDSLPLYKDLSDEKFQRLNTYEDEVSFKEIKTPKYSALFKAPEGWNNTFQTKSHIWSRYRLKNTSPNPMIVTISATRFEEHIYVSRNGKWEHFVSGDMVPWSRRDGIKDASEIPVALSAGEEVMVYHNFGDVTFWSNPFPRIGNYLKIARRSFEETQNFSADDVISFGFFGFMVFAIIFNLFIYYVTREKVYMVFSLMLVASAFLLAENAFSQLAFSEWRRAYPFFLVLTITFFIIMLLHTVRFFFRVPVHFPNWDKFLVYFSVYIGLSGTLAYLAMANQWVIFLLIITGITTLSALIFFIAAIIMIISFVRKKDKEARLFVIAAMPFIVSPVIDAILPFDWVITTCGMWTILVLSWGMFARFKSLQEANARAKLEREEERNKLIAQQKLELEQLVEERTAELSHSLAELKQTQNQLIQSEKMASLGELTAGIAHEIQNPLNFVNNFSEVSIELLEELKDEMEKGDTEEAMAIVGDVTQNLGKINHHGKRADAIVKGMLQHSRASSGQKEPTDINALADEYLRLAYHGLRAKDKSFNAELITNFGENLPKVNAIPQDLGRVLLNLFTNAFYATQQKSIQLQSSVYKPVLTVTTLQRDDTIEIRVKDNGTGIPDEIQDKILQPFFTTKPTGEGTGLGLSLSYDIVVKGHGGTIDIESGEGEGSEFIIQIPI